MDGLESNRDVVQIPELEKVSHQLLSAILGTISWAPSGMTKCTPNRRLCQNENVGRISWVIFANLCSRAIKGARGNAMKLTLSFTIVLLMASAKLSAQGVFDRIKQSATDKVNQRVDDKTNSTIDKGLDSAEGAASSKAKPKSSQASAADAAPRRIFQLPRRKATLRQRPR